VGTLKVVVWNMQSQKGAANWDRLLEWRPIAQADLYLLCEAVVAPEHVAGVLEVRMDGSTKESRCPCEGEKCDNPGRQFSTAIAVPVPRRVQTIPFKPGFRVGTWKACSVDLGGMRVTAIALYGLGDSGFDTYYESTDFALSEIVPILEHPEYGEHVLLGGDFNILAGAPPDASHSVLARIKDCGLVDCLDRGLELDLVAWQKQGLPADRFRSSDSLRQQDMLKCQCGKREGCTHIRTFFKQSDPDTPHQDDYLFASPDLAGLLVKCDALPVGADSPSDHAPIVAEFDISP
jgi:hypothetical protein